MINKNKLYILPMKKVCNANCTWCISKQNAKSDVREKMKLDQEFWDNFSKYLPLLIQTNFEKLEFTGGGEPFLNENLQQIINYFVELFPRAYSKLYTNGFILKEIQNINELNISRSHWDSNLNNQVYKSKFQNYLEESVTFFRPMVKKLRICTVMQKGIIDSELKAVLMINKLPEVDQFVFRPIIPETKNHEHLVVNFEIKHSKALKDEIDCTCHQAIVLAPNGKLYYDFNFKDEILLEDLCGLLETK